MNLGECPYDGCTGYFMVPLPDGDLPKYRLMQCDECGRDVWYKLSRVDPMCWTREAFERENVIDEETRTITPRKEPT